MRRKHHKLVCKFDYCNEEYRKISWHQVQFAGGFNILDQLEKIGAIHWEIIPGETHTRVIAKLDITMPCEESSK